MIIIIIIIIIINTIIISSSSSSSMIIIRNLIIIINTSTVIIIIIASRALSSDMFAYDTSSTVTCAGIVAIIVITHVASVSGSASVNASVNASVSVGVSISGAEQRSLWLLPASANQGLARNMRKAKLSFLGVSVERASWQTTGIDYPVCASMSLFKLLTTLDLSFPWVFSNLSFQIYIYIYIYIYIWVFSNLFFPLDCIVPC